MTKEATKEVTIKDVLEVVTTYGWVAVPMYEMVPSPEADRIRSVSLHGAIILAVAQKMLDLPEKEQQELEVRHYRCGMEVLMGRGYTSYQPWRDNYKELVKEVEVRIHDMGHDLVIDYAWDEGNEDISKEEIEEQIKERGFDGIEGFNRDADGQGDIEAILS